MRDEMRDQQTMDEIEVSTELLLASVEALRDDQVAAPTLLPGWTRGHVLTHLARSADSLGRLLEWARTGVEQQQYASVTARAQEIEAGARRSVNRLAADIRASATRFEESVNGLPEPAWEVEVRPRTGELCTPSRLVFLRLRELEVHHVDLAAGYTFADIPEPVATLVIDDIVTTLASREDTPAIRIEATDVDLERELGRHGPLLSGTQADLLAWISGRSDGTGLSVTGADAVPAAATWI